MPRTKGSKNRLKTNNDYASLNTEITSIQYGSHWCQALLNFYKHINSYLQTEYKVIDL